MGVTYAHYLIPRDNSVRPEPARIVGLLEALVETRYIVLPDRNSTSENVSDPNNYEWMWSSGPGARFMTRPASGVAPAPQPAPDSPRLWWKHLFSRPVATSPAWVEGPWRLLSMPPQDDLLGALGAPFAEIECRGDPAASYPMRTLTQSATANESPMPHHVIIEVSDDFINPDSDRYGMGALQVRGVCICGHDLAYEGENYMGEEMIRRICPACGATFRPQDQIAEVPLHGGSEKRPQPGGLCSRFAIILDFNKDHPTFVRTSSGDFDCALPRVTADFMETCTTALGIEMNEFELYG